MLPLVFISWFFRSCGSWRPKSKDVQFDACFGKWSCPRSNQGWSPCPWTDGQEVGQPWKSQCRQEVDSWAEKGEKCKEAQGGYILRGQSSCLQVGFGAFVNLSMIAMQKGFVSTLYTLFSLIFYFMKWMNNMYAKCVCGFVLWIVMIRWAIYYLLLQQCSIAVM